uniref:chloroplast envelope membrane protein n=1 Tax=Chlorococcum tatrense TaxID=915274 RepID=UPI0010C4F442|nr:chloroplast envelope membrane protein [Chlorococcum tatrense]AYQ94366.1 chloroplast envelope membrane protein [Chlorococcum tatrense]
MSSLNKNNGFNPFSPFLPGGEKQSGGDKLRSEARPFLKKGEELSSTRASLQPGAEKQPGGEKQSEGIFLPKGAKQFGEEKQPFSRRGKGDKLKSEALPSGDELSSSRASLQPRGEEPPEGKVGKGGAYPLWGGQQEQKQEVVSITYEEIGLFPRSFSRVLDRFLKQVFSDVENLVIQEYRFYRYLFLTTLKCLLILFFIPFFVNFLAKTYVVRPLTEYFWNTKQTEIFLNSYQQKRAFAELKEFEEKTYFESLIFPKSVFVSNLSSTPIFTSLPLGEEERPKNVAPTFSEKESKGVLTFSANQEATQPFPYKNRKGEDLLNGFETKPSIGLSLPEGNRTLSPKQTILYIREGNQKPTLKIEAKPSFSPLRGSGVGEQSSLGAKLPKSFAPTPFLSSGTKGFFSKQPIEVGAKLLKSEAPQEFRSSTPHQQKGIEPSSWVKKSFGYPPQLLPSSNRGREVFKKNSSFLNDGFFLIASDRGARRTVSEEKVHEVISSSQSGATPTEKEVSRIKQEVETNEASLLQPRGFLFKHEREKSPTLFEQGLNTFSEESISNASPTRGEESFFQRQQAAYSSPLINKEVEKKEVLRFVPNPFSFGSPAIAETDYRGVVTPKQTEHFINSYNMKSSLFVYETQEADKNIQQRYQEKTIELAQRYNDQSIEAITNLFADLISLLTLFYLLYALEIQINITKSFLLEVFFGLDDSKKSLLILLITDLLVGYHSSNLWELFFEFLFHHYGLPESQTGIFLLVATLPVLLDVLFKYLIFRHLNRSSPATVATYHAMIE